MSSLDGPHFKIRIWKLITGKKNLLQSFFLKRFIFIEENENIFLKKKMFSFSLFNNQPLSLHLIFFFNSC